MLKELLFLKSSTALLLLVLVSAVFTQEPVFIAPVETKSYKRIPNPLFRNTLPLKVMIINDEAYIDGDIYLGTKDYLDRFQISQNKSRDDFPVLSFAPTFSAFPSNNLRFDGGLWFAGRIPFVFESGFTTQEVQTLVDAMNDIARRTNVCFIRRTNEPGYIRFRKVSVEEMGFRGGSSHIGRCGWCPTGQDIKFSVMVTERLANHEIGHALGLFHEHSRADRDNFIEILWNNVRSDSKDQFIQLPFTDAGNYDFNSVMHYNSTAFGLTNSDSSVKQTIRRRSNSSDTNFGTATVLSGSDILTINALYPIDSPCSSLELSQIPLGTCGMGDGKQEGCPCSFPIDCKFGLTCKDNRCITIKTPSPPQCPKDFSCPPGTKCDNGKCVADNPPCGRNNWCPPGRKCVNGRCVPR